MIVSEAGSRHLSQCNHPGVSEAFVAVYLRDGNYSSQLSVSPVLSKSSRDTLHRNVGSNRRVCIVFMTVRTYGVLLKSADQMKIA